MPVVFEIDPVSEDAGNAPLALIEPGYRLTAMDLTPPPTIGQYATSADTEGDIPVGYKHSNRIVAADYLVMGATDTALETAMQGLQQKVDKLRHERGTLKLTTMTGNTVVGDVYNAAFRELTFDRRYVHNRIIPIKLEFECAPYFRGAPVLLSDHVETTLPCLTFTETGLAGDIPGLGKLVIDDDQANIDQWWAVWGIRSRYYDAASTAALFYEAESRTPLGGAATAAGPSGASGAGSNVVRHTGPTPAWNAILSTQASGGGAHLTHKGGYRVFARVQASLVSGVYQVAFEWTQGDFVSTARNRPQTLGDNAPGDLGTWQLLDLGLVFIAPDAGRWEGRVVILTTSPPTAQIDIDWLMFVPIDEGSGEATANAQASTGHAYSARDEFNQTAGALAGKTLPLGGTWVGAGGDPDDFAVETTGKTAQRTAVSDAGAVNLGRVAIAGTTTFTDVAVQADFKKTVLNSAHLYGVMARYVDDSNYAAAWLFSGSLHLVKRVAGTETLLALGGVGVETVNAFTTIRLVIDAMGRANVWVGPQGGRLDLVASAYDSVLATGGTLASGKAGFHDNNGDATAITRNIDNFSVAIEPRDAAIFAGQSLEVRNDRVIRKDQAGVVTRPINYEGDLLLVPPAGKENRTAQLIVKTSRNQPGALPDAGIDDISARLTYTPRYLVLPA